MNNLKTVSSVVIFAEENDIKTEKEIEFRYTERAHKLSRMNIVDRLNEVEILGDDHVYRFQLEAQLNRDDKYDFSLCIDICANNYDEAEQAAIDFFFGTHLEAVLYYIHFRNKADVKFLCRNLFTAEEAAEYNQKEIEEEEEFMNFLSLI